MQLEPYIDPDAHWGSWHLSRAPVPCTVYNVRHGYAELSLNDIPTIEALRERVRMIADKSWCTDSELASLSRALEATIGFAIEVERNQPPRGPAWVSEVVARLVSGRANTRVWFRDSSSRPLRPDIHYRLRKTRPR